MSDIFVSYARNDEAVAERVVAALRAAGRDAWRDDLLPVHRAYAEVIEERLRASRAVIVLWSESATASQWVRSEANRAREYGKLIQATLDGGLPPMPFDQIQCADLRGWSGDPASPQWAKVTSSIAALMGEDEADPALAAQPVPLQPYAQPRLPQRLAFAPQLLLVGRDDEIAAIDAAWRQALDGKGQVVLLGGEPGIGKTRLASDFARSAHADGAIVLFGHCDEDVALPYRPFRDALRFYFASMGDGVVRRDGAAHGAGLVHLLPDLREALRQPVASDSADDGETERMRLFEAVEGVLARACADAPVLLMLDDLHWAGASDLLLLKHLVRAAAGLRLLILATYRESDVTARHALAPVLADLRREPTVKRLSLSGIDAGAISDLLAASGVETDGALAETLRESTAGNPFFLGQLIHQAEVDGAAALADGAAVPPSVRETVDRRINRLAPETAKLLSVAAIIGQQFALPILEAVVDDIDESHILDALDEGVAASLIAETPGEADCYRFNHAIVRLALCEATSGARRRRMHRRIGEVLESRAGGATALLVNDLAYHWSAAGDVSKALTYLKQAGDINQGALAFESAIESFSRALALLESAPEGQDRVLECDLIIGLATAQRSAGIIAFRETMARATAIARGLPDGRRLAIAALGSGHLNGLQWSNGIDDALVALYAEALAALGDGDTGLRVRLMGQLAVELRHGPERMRRDQLTAEALAQARTLDDPATLGRALAARILSIESPFSLDERLVLTRELEDVASATGNLGLATQAGHLRVDALLQNGDIEAAERALERCEAAAARQHVPYFALFPQTLRTMLAVMRGDADADAQITANFQAMSAIGMPHAQNIFAIQMFELLVRRGMVAGTLDQIRASQAALPHIVAFRIALIFTLGEVGRLDEARAQIDAFAQIGCPVPKDMNWASAMHMLAEGSAVIRDARAASVHYADVKQVADQVGMAVGVKCDGALAHSAGLFASLLGDHDAAVAHLEFAIALNDRIGARPAAVASRRALARLSIDNHRGDFAVTLLDDAEAAAGELGLVNEQHKLRALRARLG